MNVREINEKLDEVNGNIEAFAKRMQGMLKEKSDLLSALQDKVGKKFTKDGKIHTICKRGDLYYLRVEGEKKTVPDLDACGDD
jgi:hypothetical protein